MDISSWEKASFNNILNQEQQKAIWPKSGILLIHAGAGSGKTRVITSRIAALIIHHNIEPEKILALTFTNKAAREMKERVSRLLQKNINLPYVGTFHSYCLRLLKSGKYLSGLNRNFTLIDQDDQNKIIKNLIKKNNLDKRVTPKQILSFISKIKNECPSLDKSIDFLVANNIYKELYMLYENEKANANCLDFDDLILKTYALFQNELEFKKEFQEFTRHILIDEYQDTNQVQHLLVKSMTLDKDSNFMLDSLCAVGDEDQSIYSWRGATVFNMLNFKKDFKDVVAITLDQNYRSVQPILYAANNLIQNNKARNIKNLWSDRVAKDRIRVVACNSGYQEGYIISEFLRACVSKSNSKSNSILYRSHFQSRLLEEALIRYSIPYKIIGGIQFYDRLEIKDTIAYLRLIVNPFDRPAFNRIINIPNRGLGEKFQERYLEIWNEQPLLNFKEIAYYIVNNGIVTKNKSEDLIKFIEIFQDLSDQDKASEVLNQIINKIRYFDYLDENFDKDEALNKKENIKELINSAIFFEKNNNFNNFMLKDFLQEISLLQELINSSSQDSTQVYLMTFHAAKGLEFDNVIIAGAEEGILPSSHSTYINESLEEERRLMYVGITRARDRLLLTHAGQRIIYGQNSNQRPSRFVNELPDDYIQNEDFAKWTLNKVQVYFQSWLLDKPVLNLNAKIYDNQLVSNAKTWKIKQKVEHKIFGVGTIENIEDNKIKIYLTVKFKDFVKKIDSKFLKTM